VSRRTVVWRVLSGLCWFVAFALAAVPVSVGEDSCGLTFHALTQGEACGEAGGRRLATLTLWLVVTGAVSLGYVVSAVRRRDDEE
jgi:hypothetical protein